MSDGADDAGNRRWWRWFVLAVTMVVLVVVVLPVVLWGRPGSRYGYYRTHEPGVERVDLWSHWSGKGGNWSVSWVGEREIRTVGFFESDILIVLELPYDVIEDSGDRLVVRFRSEEFAGDVGPFELTWTEEGLRGRDLSAPASKQPDTEAGRKVFNPLALWYVKWLEWFGDWERVH